MSVFRAIASVIALSLAIGAAAQPFPNAPVAGFTLTTNISTLSYSGEFVEVSWTGNPSPTIGDVVGLYVVAPNTTVDTLVPLRFNWVNKSPTNQQGSGSLVFQCLNQRYPIQFVYFKNITSGPYPFSGYTSKKVTAVSNTIAVNPNEPTQGHLTFTNVTGEVVVQWTTRDVGTPVVKYGTSAGALTSSVAALSATYLRSQMVGQPANTVGYFDPGQLHYGTITGLAPQTTYYYQFGDATPGAGFSAVFSFTTPPAPGASASVKWLAWADAGQATYDGSLEYDYYDDYDFLMTSPFGTLDQVYASAFDTWQIEQAQQGGSIPLVARLTAELTAWNPTLAINNGDIAYARGFVTQWDQYFEQYKGIYTRLPVMTLPGNHERDAPNTGDRFYPLQSRTDSGGEAGIPYELRLRMPTPSQREEWYSFNYGPIHFIQTSTEQPFGAGSPQWQFVVKDLQTVDRTMTPWVIVGFHRPIYTSSLEGVTLASDQGVAADLRNAWETIFYQYEVDMTWSGHVHVYERTCPVLFKTCLGYDANGHPLAPVHMDIGNGGYDLTWFITPSPAPYFEAVVLEHGYTRGEANATHLHIQAFSSETGRLLDDFTLTKAANYAPNITARNDFLASGFQSTYQAPFYEARYAYDFGDPGLSPNVIFGTTFFNPLAALLKNSTALLQALKDENVSTIVDINAPDNVYNLHQVFDAYYSILQEPGFLAQTPDSNLANLFISKVFDPLFQLFDKNSAAQVASNGAIDAGVIVNPFASPTPSPSAPLPAHGLALPPLPGKTLTLPSPQHLVDALTNPLSVLQSEQQLPDVGSRGKP